jgi:hypothetical protein
MANKKKNPPEDFDINELSVKERMKYEVAMELGLYDKVLEQGWKALSSKETGRIGGIVSRRQKNEEKEEVNAGG